jgi:ankyrin repeat protein
MINDDSSFCGIVMMIALFLMVRLPPKSSQPVPRNADLDARDESGWLPVHWAAQSGSVETMCNLHYLGADFVSRWIWRWMIFFWDESNQVVISGKTCI